MQAIRSARAVLDLDHLVGRACQQARRVKPISFDDPAVRQNDREERSSSSVEEAWHVMKLALDRRRSDAGPQRSLMDVPGSSTLDPRRGKTLNQP